MFKFGRLCSCRKPIEGIDFVEFHFARELSEMVKTVNMSIENSVEERTESITDKLKDN